METQKNHSAPHAEPEPQPKIPGGAPPDDLAGGLGHADEEGALLESDLGAGGGRGPKRVANNTRRLRMERMMSKAELARRAGVSTLTIDRVERGMNCRMDTKRKIIEALGLKPSDRSMVFAEDE